MAQITDLLVHAYMDAITALYADVQPESDRPTIVKEGRLQDDPTKYVFSVMVSPNDYADDTWADIPTSRGDSALDHWQMKVNAYEIGGGEAWWRRGIIEWQIFGIKPKYDHDTIFTKAAYTKGRLERVVETLKLGSMVDEFGEVAKISLPVWSNMFRSGGEKSQALIWRGKIRWQVLTERSVALPGQS